MRSRGRTARSRPGLLALSIERDAKHLRFDCELLVDWLRGFGHTATVAEHLVRRPDGSSAENFGGRTVVGSPGFRARRRALREGADDGEESSFNPPWSGDRAGYVNGRGRSLALPHPLRSTPFEAKALESMGLSHRGALSSHDSPHILELLERVA